MKSKFLLGALCSMLACMQISQVHASEYLIKSHEGKALQVGAFVGALVGLKKAINCLYSINERKASLERDAELLELIELDSLPVFLDSYWWLKKAAVNGWCEYSWIYTNKVTAQNKNRLLSLVAAEIQKLNEQSKKYSCVIAIAKRVISGAIIGAVAGQFCPALLHMLNDDELTLSKYFLIGSRDSAAGLMAGSAAFLLGTLFI